MGFMKDWRNIAMPAFRLQVKKFQISFRFIEQNANEVQITGNQSRLKSLLEFPPSRLPGFGAFVKSSDHFHFDFQRQPFNVIAVHLAWQERERVGRAGGGAPATRFAQIIAAPQA
jgi:hypothetical protein